MTHSISWSREIKIKNRQKVVRNFGTQHAHASIFIMLCWQFLTLDNLHNEWPCLAKPFVLWSFCSRSIVTESVADSRTKHLLFGWCCSPVQCYLSLKETVADPTWIVNNSKKIWIFCSGWICVEYSNNKTINTLVDSTSQLTLGVVLHYSTITYRNNSRRKERRRKKKIYIYIYIGDSLPLSSHLV